ncbi:MAG: cation diffusion facilitator family transporter [Spirochaetales bacterium]|nr:cation diffusion facilitator family transporter [Spirochaetales bacterium]
MRESARIEQNALKFSMVSIIFFVLLAFVFSFITGSDSILFDGIYSLISLVIAILTLKVSRLAELPDDERFHFGYTRLEPVLNVSKSLFILISCVYALVIAVKSLYEGGNQVDAGFAVIYSAVAAGGGFIISFYLRYKAKKSSSGLLKVEVVEWMVDSFLSLGILLGFIIALLIENSKWSHFTPYVDPILLIVITALSLTAPIKVLIENLQEIIGMAPPESVVAKIEGLMDEVTSGLSLNDYEFRIIKHGRDTFMLVHLIVSDDFHFNEVSELDQIRNSMEKKIRSYNPEISMEILFIKDKSWAKLR